MHARIQCVVFRQTFRKGGMLLNNVLAFIAAALMGFSKLANAWPLLLVGRIIIGVNAGNEPSA